MIDKLNISDIKPSSRRYPAIIFEQEREAGDQILHVENLSKSIDGELLLRLINELEPHRLPSLAKKVAARFRISRS